MGEVFFHGPQAWARLVSFGTAVASQQCGGNGKKTQGQFHTLDLFIQNWLFERLKASNMLKSGRMITYFFAQFTGLFPLKRHINSGASELDPGLSQYVC